MRCGFFVQNNSELMSAFITVCNKYERDWKIDNTKSNETVKCFIVEFPAPFTIFLFGVTLCDFFHGHFEIDPIGYLVSSEFKEYKPVIDERAKQLLDNPPLDEKSRNTDLDF